MQYCSGKSRISKSIADEICKWEVKDFFCDCDSNRRERERERVKRQSVCFVERVQ